MKAIKILVILSVCIISINSCIKKSAIKYDPEMVGSWVGVKDSTSYWFNVTEDGFGTYRVYKSASDDRIISGKVKYSVFELKMWVGSTKFKVKEWLTGGTAGVDSIATRNYNNLAPAKYSIDRMMIIKSTLFNENDLVSLYRIRQ